jgi:hypothetical protein
MLMLMVGCGLKSSPTIQLTNTEPDQPSQTPDQVYRHYSPKKNAEIQLAFDYPRNRIFTKENHEFGEAISTIFLDDPKVYVLSTETTASTQSPSQEFGSVVIAMNASDQTKPISEKAKSTKHACETKPAMKLLKDYEITIDGVKAQVVECLDDPSQANGYTASMFRKQIFFEKDDQDFWLLFLIPMGERNSDFEKGCDHFVESLKFVK